MRRLRSRLARFTAACLVWQAMILALAPVDLAGRETLTATCDCPGGMAQQSCPMHRSPNREAQAGDSVIQSTCVPTDAALISLSTGLGVLPSLTSTPQSIRIEAVSTLTPRAVRRVVDPELSPPRA